jgi:flagellar biosynthesis chaperone FliJ
MPNFKGPQAAQLQAQYNEAKNNLSKAETELNRLQALHATYCAETGSSGSVAQQLENAFRQVERYKSILAQYSR